MNLFVKNIFNIFAHRRQYSAIIVPQRIDTRLPLIEVVMEGVSYICNSRFVFKPGMEHLVNVVIDKNANQTKIDINGNTTKWQ